MIKTPITQMLGIEYPIIGGTMMWLSKVELTAAISEAGALGILASANYKELDEFRAALKAIQDKTDKPFAVNLNMFPALQQMDNNLYLDVMQEEGVSIVETSGHSAPEDIAHRLAGDDLKWIHKCVAPRYALKAQGLGCDAVTIVGFENGGAVGMLGLSTLVTVPRVIDAVNVPVIGGGGVGDGRGVAALLSLGAAGVILGSRFMACEEAPIHPKVREKMIALQEHETTLIMESVKSTHRVAQTPNAFKVQQMEQEGKGLEDLLTIIGGKHSAKLFYEGDLDSGLLWIGQAVGFIHKIQPAKDLVQELVAEAEESLKRTNGLIS